ncbi:hypothetical protein [Chitinophaga nivalis]|uniref:DUF4397 domain-containing protein n=1 Tax=Chitinophaga nivalis TaxID=2991709 RepID=A0ABT3IPG6_9BACT|nr:hypothetical protein [Chitinophaga nivalis]MCW3464481.1 hypothetical protein [Chitinophaga nivalis]MCW3485828.1 hypothetical protein [Chitinophaga nivalis]
MKLAIYLIIPAIIALLIAGCNKDDLRVEKSIHIVINGYNGSTNELEVAIDTTRYGKSSSREKSTIPPAAVSPFNTVYTYYSGQNPGSVTITDPVTQKELFNKPLPASGTKAFYNFIYLDGKELEIKVPAADAATNKLVFYIYDATNETPFDVFLYRIDNNTGQEFRQNLAKNVKANTWFYTDYIPSADFNSKNMLSSSYICFTKAGTIDQWAFQDSESMSKLSAFGMALPIGGEKGIVQAYFIVPGRSQLEKSSLFFHPDRPW